MSDMTPAEVLAEEGAILEMEQQRNNLPLAGEGGDTARNRATLAIADRRAALWARQNPVPTPRTAEDVAAGVAARKRDADLDAALRAELESAPAGSPKAVALLGDIEALATARLRAQPPADSGAVSWADYDRTLAEWNDVERRQFGLIFRALGLDALTAIQLGSAWAAGAENEPTDFRREWGEDFTANDAAFWRLAGRIPAAIRDKWITPTIRHRPQFVKEVLRVVRERGEA
jgi:hypothetical protein